MNIANHSDLNYKLSKNQRLQVELALLKMCNLSSAFRLASIPPPAMSDTEGQLKKKPDTPAIAPPAAEKMPAGIPVVSDTPAAYSVSKPQPQPQPVPQPEPVAAEKPRVFIPNLNVASSTRIPSLKDIDKVAETTAEDDDPYLKGTDQVDFTFDDFLRLWNQHAATIKAEGKMSLFTIFISEVPRQLSKYQFEIVVETKVQENLFKNEKPAILNFLRSTLRNFSLDVTARVDEQVVVKRPYTSQEKFQYMAAKNPELLELKKRFNLDFD
jgi:DNA polymerase-3 subunit gamma/tau